MAYKNFGISLLRINFVHYVVPAFLFYIPYLLFMVLVGASMSSVESLYSGDSSWSSMSPAAQARFIFTMVLMGITVFLMLGFIVYTVIVFRRIRKEIRTEKERKQLEKGKNSIEK